jgi:HAMP domain-containing protein
MIIRFFGRIPLRFILITPFVMIILATAGLIGYLSFRNSQRAVNDLAAQLHSETASRINQQLDAYLQTPLLSNNLNLDAIRLKQLNVDDQDALKLHFLAQMQRFPAIVALTYAAEDRLYSAITWRDSYGVDLGVAFVSAATDNAIEGYAVTPQGDIGEPVLSIPDYDPRVRPWYQAAVQAGQQTWTPIYLWTSEDVGIDAVVPVYGDDGRLTGVMDTSLTLSGIGDFLQNVRVSPHGGAFIVDDQGLLVASSTILKPYTSSGESVTRLSALDGGDPAMRAAAEHLLNRFGDWPSIHTSEPFRFDVAGKREFAQVTLYQNNGLQWWLVVMIPESDFMGQINASNRSTLLLIGIALIAAVVVTTLMARWVTRPILQLNRASKALAAGQWSQIVAINRRDEVGELAHSFNTMAEQQQALFARCKPAKPVSAPFSKAPSLRLAFPGLVNTLP